MKSKTCFVLISFLLVLILTIGCGQATPVVKNTPVRTIEDPPDVQSTPTETSVITEQPSSTPTQELLEPLPPEPQAVTFTTSSGTELNGYYYPAAINPAPLVVLMHWTNGDMSDWYEIALWLQNRRQINPFTNPAIPGSTTPISWLDPTWFPALPDEKSYGVFIFSFSGSYPFPNIDKQIDFTNWVDDAQSAMLKALELEGVDPTRIVTIGSAQGADAAAEGCLFLNENQPGSCKGVVSLSPTGYIGRGIVQTIDALGKATPGIPIWYICNEYEAPPAETLTNIEISFLHPYTLPGMNSGTMFLRPDLDPLPIQLILDFLDETVK